MSEKQPFVGYTIEEFERLTELKTKLEGQGIPIKQIGILLGNTPGAIAKIDGRWRVVRYNRFNRLETLWRLND